jgi:hypothetical protein
MLYTQAIQRNQNEDYIYMIFLSKQLVYEHK